MIHIYCSYLYTFRYSALEPTPTSSKASITHFSRAELKEDMEEKVITVGCMAVPSLTARINTQLLRMMLVTRPPPPAETMLLPVPPLTTCKSTSFDLARISMSTHAYNF